MNNEKEDMTKRTPIGQVVRMRSGRILSPEEYKKEIYDKYERMRVFGPYPKTTTNICPCTDPVNSMANLAARILEDIEEYKDIAVGGVEISNIKGKEITTFDIMEKIEKNVKDIIVQKNKYDKCCFPEEDK